MVEPEPFKTTYPPELDKVPFIISNFPLFVNKLTEAVVLIVYEPISNSTHLLFGIVVVAVVVISFNIVTVVLTPVVGTAPIASASVS